jgi:hypothetical protein
MLQLLQGLPWSWEVLRPLEPHLCLSLSLLYKNELGSTILAKPHLKMVFGIVPTHGLSHIGYSSYRLTLTRGENGFWKCANKWPAGHTLAQLILCLMPLHFLVSYCLWLCLILDIMNICMDFGPYGVSPSSDVPEMVDLQNSQNSLVIGTYLLYLEWNVGMLVVNICIFWPPIAPGVVSEVKAQAEAKFHMY